MFMHYHEGEYLSVALEANNLSIIELNRQNYPVKDEINNVDLMIIAKK